MHSSGRTDRESPAHQQNAHLEASDQLVLGLGQLSLGGRPQQRETHDIICVDVHEQLGLRDGIHEASSRRQCCRSSAHKLDSSACSRLPTSPAAVMEWGWLEKQATWQQATWQQATTWGQYIECHSGRLGLQVHVVAAVAI